MRTWPIAALLLVSSSAVAERPYERRVIPGELSASSTRGNVGPAPRTDDHVNFLADDDAGTAWSEGSPGDGTGERIELGRLELGEVSRVRLRVRSGCQARPGDFAAHPRPRRLTVRLAPAEVSRTVELADTPAWQDVVVEQPTDHLFGVVLSIESVFPGSASSDLCVSDVQIFATSTVKDRPEQTRRERAWLRDWSRHRVEAARVFARAGGRVPLLPAYALDVLPGDDLLDGDEREACLDEDPCYTRAVVEKLRAGRRGEEAAVLALAARALAADAELAPVSIVGDPLPIPYVEGFRYGQVVTRDEDPDGLQLPLAGGLGAFTVDGLRARPLTGKPHGDLRAWDAGRDAEGRRAFRIERRDTVPGRLGDVLVTMSQVVVYGRDGRLALVAGGGRVDLYAWGQDGGRAVIVGGERRFDGGHWRLRARRAAESATTPG